MPRKHVQARRVKKLPRQRKELASFFRVGRCFRPSDPAAKLCNVFLQETKAKRDRHPGHSGKAAVELALKGLHASLRVERERVE
jgi:hypothetical protein